MTISINAKLIQRARVKSLEARRALDGERRRVAGELFAATDRLRSDEARIALLQKTADDCRASGLWLANSGTIMAALVKWMPRSQEVAFRDREKWIRANGWTLRGAVAWSSKFKRRAKAA